MFTTHEIEDFMIFNKLFVNNSYYKICIKPKNGYLFIGGLICYHFKLT